MERQQEQKQLNDEAGIDSVIQSQVVYNNQGAYVYKAIDPTMGKQKRHIDHLSHNNMRGLLSQNGQMQNPLSQAVSAPTNSIPEKEFLIIKTYDDLNTS